MLEILTPLIKIHRVPRTIDPATFTARPGMFANLKADGSLENVVTGTIPTNPKMVVNSASSNKYESNDVEVGRCTTIEDIGVRFTVDSDVITGNPTVGNRVSVSCIAGFEGRLFDVVETPNAEAGTYPVVAVVEEKDSIAGTWTLKTVSPTTVVCS